MIVDLSDVIHLKQEKVTVFSEDIMGICFPLHLSCDFQMSYDTEKET